MYRWPVVLLLLGGIGMGAHADTQAGLWLTPRNNPGNHARADVAGRMEEAPEEVWRVAVGGDVRFAQTVRIRGRESVLVQSGTTLQLLRPDGSVRWERTRLGVGRVLRVDDFDGDGREEVLIVTDPRTIVLLDVATGRRLWSWQAPPSTSFSGHAFYRTPTGLRLIATPAYDRHGYCFDFSGDRRNPRLLWQQAYPGLYGVGYGPSIVLADMDGDGRTDVVLSGKVSEGVVNAVLDMDTGAVKTQVKYAVEEQSWGRPYGLLHAVDLDQDGFPDVVMVSCQVEEYIAVARNVDGRTLEPIWTKFVEKDWPTDHLELRPQITSVADVDGDGKPELVVGMWEEGAWRTVVIDPLEGFESRRETEPGWYFWGNHDITGDGVAEVIVSREDERLTSRVTTLAALDGRTLQPVAQVRDAAILTSSDSPMPQDRYFMAGRSNPVEIRTEDGFSGIGIQRFRRGQVRGIALWGAVAGGETALRPLDGRAFGNIKQDGEGVLLTDSTGDIQRFDADLRPKGEVVSCTGRTCTPLVWSREGRRELVFEAAGARIVGGVPDLERSGVFASSWEVAGRSPALHIDAQGTSRLAAVDVSDRLRSAALIYEDPGQRGAAPLRIPLEHPPYEVGSVLPHGDDFRLLVSLRTGVHTFALAIYDAAGELLWHDDAWGAYPRAAAAWDLTGDGLPEVITDDHGLLKVYGSDGQVLAGLRGWPPAYTLQIVGPFLDGEEPVIVRASGIQGVSLVNAAGENLWLTTCSIWKYYRSLGAVGDVAGDGTFQLGMLDESGVLDCIEVATGEVRWSLDLDTTPGLVSVIAGDVTGDGRDEFLLGTADGRLICIGERESQGKILWSKSFSSEVANPILVDLDGDGVAEIVVSTGDGFLRILR